MQIPVTLSLDSHPHGLKLPTCFALLPNTNSMASITLDLPLPLGPTTDEKHCNQHVIVAAHRQSQGFAVTIEAIPYGRGQHAEHPHMI